MSCFLKLCSSNYCTSSSRVLPALKKFMPSSPNTPHPPRLTNTISFVLLGNELQNQGDKTPCTSLANQCYLECLLCLCLAKPDRRGSLFYFSLISPNFLSQTLFILLSHVREWRWLWLCSLCGASQEPRQAQHRQCLQ